MRFAEGVLPWKSAQLADKRHSSFDMKFEEQPRRIHPADQGEEDLGYSLDRWRNASEQMLSPEELAFLDRYADQLDQLVLRVKSNPALGLAILRESLRPNAWRVIAGIGKAEALLAKVGRSRSGQFALAQEEAESLNAEYDRRAAAVQVAIRDFVTFVDELNGQGRIRNSEP